MSSEPENPSAFPIPATPEASYYPDFGMSLRDYFAGQALVGFIAGSQIELHDPENIPSACYAVADVMLKERGEA